MDSQMMPAGFEAAEFKEQKPKHFEHEDLLGQDRDLDVASEPLIDFSSAEDQVLLSSIDATTQIQGLDADSKSDAQQDGGGSDIGAARVDLASELSFLTQELEGIGADSELHLRSLDAETLDTTEFLESLADGKLDLADYDLGKDSINLDQELAGLDGLDAGSLMISQPTSGFSEDRVSNFDFEKELANLGNLGLDPEPHKAETAEDLDLGDMDLIGSGDDLKQELSDLSFLDDETGSQDKIQTMLDLAEAYIQMGDAEGAREILIEVQQEGGQAQQAKAKAMLDSIKPH
jgi:pilus assembly protein FimV